MNKTNTVAAIMAHPDDEVLGCGGSPARLSRSGASVHIFILATGLTSRGLVDNTSLLALKYQARSAADRLGATTIDFADFLENAMDSVKLLDIVKHVGSFSTKTEPDLIFRHHNGDINIDHDLTQRAVMTATRALPGRKPFNVLACEVLSSTEFGPANKRQQPRLYLRLTEDDAKAAIDALVCYEGEIRDWPHPRSAKALEHQLRLRGAECGVEAADVFDVLKMVC
ncbi:PIG-L family deacetylase [Alphaproteobacteria bacterium]|nr:PIG-L family deacetylase [Alphaproteobacteria bacterium]